MLARDAERLAEPPRPGAEQPRVVEPAPLAHRLEPVRRLERPHEHGARDALVLADEVQAPVDAVGAVDVRVPGRAEHRGVARGTAAVAVARRVLVVVGLDLDDRAADAVDEQRRADQRRRDLVDAAGEEPQPGSARVVADEGGDGKGDQRRYRRRRASPPETIEKRRLVSEATSPASTLPSAGVAATCANSMPETRPRSGSGVALQRIVAAQDGADVVRRSRCCEQEQGEPERLGEAEGGDRDAPERGRDRRRSGPAGARGRSSRRPARPRARRRRARRRSGRGRRRRRGSGRARARGRARAASRRPSRSSRRGTCRAAPSCRRTKRKPSAIVPQARPLGVVGRRSRRQPPDRPERRVKVAASSR